MSIIIYYLLICLTYCGCLQIAYTILFAILVSLISDALSGTAEMPSILAVDATFHKEFQQQVVMVNNQ